MAALAPYVIPALIVVVPDYLFFRWNLVRNKAAVVAAARLPGRVLRLDLDLPGRKPEPGQWVYVSVPEISRTQAHPFSVCLPGTKDKGSPVTLFIKDMGKDTFSGQLFDLVPMPAFASKSDETSVSVSDEARPFTVAVDGPYGRPSVDVDDAVAVVLVAGGIGATPIVSHLVSFLRDANRDVAVTFSWVFREERAVEWFPDVLADATADDRVDVSLHCTSLSSSGSASASGLVVSSGRPDYQDLFDEVKESGVARAVVLVCGPAGLVTSVYDAANACSSSSFAIDVSAETFLF